MDQTELDYQAQMKLLWRSIGYWKIVAYFGIPSAILIIVFGMAFQTMFFGLCIGMLGLVIVWNSAYRFIVRIFRLENLPANLLQPQKSAYISAILWLFASLVIIGMGMYLLIQIGFCWQNFICLFFIALR